jgi:lipoprotein NlpI
VACLAFANCGGAEAGGIGYFGDGWNMFHELDFAIAAANEELEINPKDVNAFVKRGMARGDKGDVDGAIADFTDALKTDPKCVLAYYARGRAKWAKGDQGGALADFTDALKIDPKCALACYARGQIKRTRGNLAGAIADFSDAVASYPDYSRAYFARGRAEYLDGNLPAAMADYTRALELDPKFLDARRHRAAARVLTRDWPGALEDYRRVCDLSEFDDQYSHLLIWAVHSRLGETADADKELADYLGRHRKTSPRGWISSVADYLLGNISEHDILVAANASSSPWIDANRLCNAWFFIGMKKLVAGDNDAAADDFWKCIATKSKGWSAYTFAQAELKALTR